MTRVPAPIAGRWSKLPWAGVQIPRVRICFKGTRHGSQLSEAGVRDPGLSSNSRQVVQTPMGRGPNSQSENICFKGTDVPTPRVGEDVYSSKSTFYLFLIENDSYQKLFT